MNAKRTEYVLSLGSNCGDRRGAVRKAIDWLRTLLEDCVWSEIYETLPVGHAGQNYMNAVCRGFSMLPADELDRCLKRYEFECGRDEESRRQNLVPIDIDIVVADSEIMRQRDFDHSFFQTGYVTLAGESFKL